MASVGARRLLVGAVAALAVAVAVAVVGVAMAGSQSANQAASRRDARYLLGRLELPAQATRLGSEAHGDHGYLKVSGVLEGDAAHSLAHGWWELPGTPDDLIAYVRAHAPAGGTLSGTATAGNAFNGTSAKSLSYRWPPVRNVLGYRELVVTATALPDGKTGVLAQTQSDWIVRRPAAEQIPPTTRVIDITSAVEGQPPVEALSVSNRSEVRKIVKLINGLPIAQPIVYACPLLTDPRIITMTFQTVTGGPALAVMTYDDFRPWSGPSEGCKTVDLTIAGRRQHPLIGGYFVQTISRILDKPLT